MGFNVPWADLPYLGVSVMMNMTISFWSSVRRAPPGSDLTLKQKRTRIIDIDADPIWQKRYAAAGRKNIDGGD